MPFGETDPYFGLDAGFYVFEFPVLQDLLSFSMSALFFGLLGAAAVHFAVGGLVSARGRAVTSAARIHLSLLAGLILVGYGLQNLLDRYGFLLDEGTLFTGLHYTDDRSRLTAKLVMAVIVFLCAGILFASGFLKRWTLAVISLALMLVSGLVLSVAYPLVVQSFQVRPNEPVLESSYVARHIEATRNAYGIEDTEIEPYTAETTVSSGQLKEDAETLPGIRLIDPAVVAPTFENQQQLRGWYSFPATLDVDRYVIDGTETDAVVAAREINYDNLPDQNWNNVHTVYTHGYGLVAAFGNRRSSSGDPVWIEKNLPPVGLLPDYEGRIYFGENTSAFAIVGRMPGEGPIEFDTPEGEPNTYTGTGGVPMGDWFTRALYATHFTDLNLLLSDRVNAESRILYDRTPSDRVAKVVLLAHPGLEHLSGGRGQPAGLDRRRLHHLGQLPEQPEGPAGRGDHRRADLTGPGCQPVGELHPQLGEGGRGRQQRHGGPVRLGAGRPDPADLVKGVPRGAEVARPDQS